YYEAGINKPALVEKYDATGLEGAYVPLTDDRGTVVGVYDVKVGNSTCGQLVEKLHYNATGLCKSFDPNGLENLTPGTDINIGRSCYDIPFGWCGMARDAFTGLYHTHFRDYDPVHGRWLSEDPAGYADGMNLYNAYMGVNGVDLLGLFDPYSASQYNAARQNWENYDLFKSTKVVMKSLEQSPEQKSQLKNEFKVAVQTIKELPGAYIETAESGEQFDGAGGWTIGAHNVLNPFFEIEGRPLYGHYEAYNFGTQCGWVSGQSLNLAMTLQGVGQAKNAINSIKASGGGMGFVQLAGGGGQTFYNSISFAQAGHLAYGVNLTGVGTTNIFDTAMNFSNGNGPTSPKNANVKPKTNAGKTKGPNRKGFDFSGSADLYPVKPGQKNIITIEYTGSRARDFGAANKAAGLGSTQKPPNGYTWHHLGNYNPKTNTGTMQLVKTGAHKKASHFGGVSQYEAVTGVPYDLEDTVRASIRAAGQYVPGQ
ncbi:MAG: HNH endonuclease, partial [Pseudomonadales bacterium]|nr:HNH endonuclease [Pseudomonadales bacterium]